MKHEQPNEPIYDPLTDDALEEEPLQLSESELWAENAPFFAAGYEVAGILHLSMLKDECLILYSKALKTSFTAEMLGDEAVLAHTRLEICSLAVAATTAHYADMLSVALDEQEIVTRVPLRIDEMIRDGVTLTPLHLMKDNLIWHLFFYLGEQKIGELLNLDDGEASGGDEASSNDL